MAFSLLEMPRTTARTILADIYPVTAAFWAHCRELHIHALISFVPQPWEGACHEPQSDNGVSHGVSPGAAILLVLQPQAGGLLRLRIGLHS